MSPLRHRSVFGANSAENGELRKVRFSCPASFVLPGPPNSLVFRRKLLQVCSAPKSVFCPEKPANSSPPSLSPPKSPVSNTSACRGTAQTQRVSNAAARRGPGSEPDSPPRFFHVTRQPAELVTADVSNTSARRGTGEESNLRNVAPETNAQAMSPWALVPRRGPRSPRGFWKTCLILPVVIRLWPGWLKDNILQFKFHPGGRPTHHPARGPAPRGSTPQLSL